MFHLKRNVTLPDRLVRLVLAVVVAYLVNLYVGAGWGQWVGWCVAAVLALTAFIGYCPAYTLFGRTSLGGRR